MKLKTEVFSPKNSPNTSIKRKMKGNRKSNIKFSPEENLGLKLEKLIEEGVKVKKIDSPEIAKKSPKLSTNGQSTPSKRVTPSKVKVTGAGVSLKSPGSKSNSEIVQKKKSPKVKNFPTEFANGSSETGKENKQSVSTPVPVDRLDLSKVIPAVKACLENAKMRDKKNKLIDSPDPLYLIFNVVKKGITASHMCRFNLPHKLVRDDADVCFIVKDEKGQSIEKTIENIEELLRVNGITRIKKILTYRQLRQEYSTHELRRKLCNAYDFFIGDGRLSRSLLQHLGKHFVLARKIPIYIKIDKKFKESLAKAFCKTAMKMKETQDSFTCVVGYRSFSAKDISENIVSVANSINRQIFPGGWENVRSIRVKSQTGSPFLIYYSSVNPNTIETPVMAPKRPKAAVPVFGELSTIDNAMVRVEPGGTVEVVKPKKGQQQSGNTKKKQKGKKEGVEKDEDDDEEEEDSDEDDESEDEEDTSDFDISDDEPSAVISPKSSKLSKAVKTNIQNVAEEDQSDDDSEGDSDESEDDIGDKAEQEYLQKMSGQLSSDDDDDDAEDAGDSDDEEVDNEGEDDDSDDEESDDISTPPNGKKRKLSLENNKMSTPPKKSKPDDVVVPNKNNAFGKGMFDTSLGETWDIRKKPQAQKSSNEKGGNMKKKGKKNQKLSKSQRKANIKTKGKKNKRR